PAGPAPSTGSRAAVVPGPFLEGGSSSAPRRLAAGDRPHHLPRGQPAAEDLEVPRRRCPLLPEHRGILGALLGAMPQHALRAVPPPTPAAGRGREKTSWRSSGEGPQATRPLRPIHRTTTAGRHLER